MIQDKRKGFWAGYKKLGPVQKGLVWLAIVSVVLGIPSCFLATKSATKKDVKEAQQGLEEGQQKLQQTLEKGQETSDKMWGGLISEIKKDKWPLDGDWNLDAFGLMDEKIRIVILADQAIWYRFDGGDYASYQELWSLKHRNNPLQSFIEDQLLKINSVLRFSYSTVARIPLCKNNKNIGNRCLEVETEADFDVKNVVAQVSHPLYWVSRAKSAYLLHFLTFQMIRRDETSWADVLDSLYASFSGATDTHKNNNVLTRYMAWESFRKHTCFADEEELFDGSRASEWWQDPENKKKVLTALESGQKSPFCQ